MQKWKTKREIVLSRLKQNERKKTLRQWRGIYPIWLHLNHFAALIRSNLFSCVLFSLSFRAQWNQNGYIMGSRVLSMPHGRAFKHAHSLHTRIDWKWEQAWERPQKKVKNKATCERSTQQQYCVVYIGRVQCAHTVCAFIYFMSIPFAASISIEQTYYLGQSN